LPAFFENTKRSAISFCADRFHATLPQGGWRNRPADGRGRGLAIAKALLGDGWKLVIADLVPGPLEAARAQLEPVRANATKCVVMDVANEPSVIAGLDGCEDGFGPVRGLVNSAALRIAGRDFGRDAVSARRHQGELRHRAHSQRRWRLRGRAATGGCWRSFYRGISGFSDKSL
jgi:hypothetical protein